MTRPGVEDGGWAEPGRATSESLSDSIIRQVRGAVLAGELASGDYLGTEKSLAERFEVSRMAVRDALRGLVAAGVVVVRPGARGGAWIAAGDPRVLSDAISVQMSLLGVEEADVIELQASTEVVAAELAAQRRTDDDVRHLEGLIADLADAVEDTTRFSAIALAIHSAINDATHNRAMVAQFSALRALLANTYDGVAQDPAMVGQVLEAQRELVAAVVAGDGVAAREHMDRRVHDVLDRLGRSVPSLARRS